MARWRDTGVYEVADGDVWKVGHHVFRCGDLVTDAGGLQTLLVDDPPDLVYADLPWSNGQLRYFRTLSGLPPVEYEWTAVARAAIQLGDGFGVPLWIVSDRAGADAVHDLLPGRHYEQWRLEDFSSKGTVGILHYSGSEPVPAGTSLEGVKDQRLPAEILQRYFAPGVICDTCAGLGITSRCAERMGWRSISNEVSPDRVSAAIRRMEKVTSQAPGLYANGKTAS